MSLLNIVLSILLIIVTCVAIILAMLMLSLEKRHTDDEYDKKSLQSINGVLQEKILLFEEREKQMANEVIKQNLENMSLKERLESAGITQEWKEQNKKDIENVNQVLQDKVKELKELEEKCGEKRQEINKNIEDEKMLLSKIEELKEILEKKRAALISVNNFEKCGFGDELPYIDYEEYFSKNNFEIVLKLLDDCIDVAPQFKSELRKIEWNLCYLPYKKTFIKDFSRSGIYMLEVKPKYENEILKELGLKRIDDRGSIVYIGQAVNVYDRWTTHIKKMLGIEAAGGEKIYKFKPLMFKWKVIEWCESSELNGREKFWIDGFKSDEFGLNSKGGNK